MTIHRRLRECIAGTMLILITPVLLAAQARGGNDALHRDPPADPAHPPSMDELSIPSRGNSLNGLIYLAGGAGPHPVVVFLHGYPGNERNLDLAQTVRRAGYDALYFDYRGSWGSSGPFTLGNGLEDVASALAWVRTPRNAAKYHFDMNRIAIVGHSYGGWLALLAGAKEPPSVCVAGMAAWNIGWGGKRFAAHPNERAENLAYFRQTTNPASGSIHGNPDSMLREMADHQNDWDYLTQAQALAKHSVFLVAATHDGPEEAVAMRDMMGRAITAAGGRHVRMQTYDDDHPFSAHRIALGDALVDWLRTDCAAQQSPRRLGQ